MWQIVNKETGEAEGKLIREFDNALDYKDFLHGLYPDNVYVIQPYHETEENQPSK
jgi:hypothetical protein